LDNPPPPEEQADITPEQEEKIALGRKIGRAFGWIIAFAGLILAMLPVIEAAKQLLDVHPAIGPLMFLIGGFPPMALVFSVASGRRELLSLFWPVVLCGGGFCCALVGGQVMLCRHSRPGRVLPFLLLFCCLRSADRV